MNRVGKVDYFDGNKRKLYFFVEDDGRVEEEGFYKVDTNDKIFYIFVTNLSEMPLDSELRARYSRHTYSFDTEERYLLYAQAAILVEYRKKEQKKIVGYKTIPRHNDEIFTLDAEDFDILGLPKLDFANVRSGSHHFDTKAGFKKESYITHWLICGWTNSGKTNATKVLLNVTVNGGGGEPFAGGVIIDPHGEYYQDLKHFNAIGAPRVFHYTLGAGSDPNERNLEVSTQNIYPTYLTEVYDFREDTQVSFMNICCRQKGGDWVRFILDNDIDGIKNGLDGVDKIAGIDLIIGATKGRMQSLFGDDDVWVSEKNNFLSQILDGVPRGNWYVIDVSSVSNRTAKVITAMVAKSLFSKYKRECNHNKNAWKTFKPAGILVEEAHNYLSPEESGKGNIIAKIAKEGRKFKVFSIVVEQDPGSIDTRILKQIHNKVVLQLIPKDARAIAETTPYVNDLENKIPYYSLGEGLFVSTGSFNFALPVKFPSVHEWVENHSKPCKKCGSPTMSATGECTACQARREKNDVTAFM
ncbi:MAG: ATP-binding protein [Candidatus Diapherotrites archaeon]|nr:ATP-binding protein [Candidatus Diapherotrites archaeon]